MLDFYSFRILCVLYCASLSAQALESTVPAVADSKAIASNLPVLFESGGAYVEPEAHPTVWIKDGGLKGFRMKTLSGKAFVAFQNVPFAQPPVESLRFRAPLQNSGWKGVREAISESPTCLQTDFIQMYNVTGAEDCLYLNVYTPKIPKYGTRERFPVLVFIHGGGFFFGSSNLYGPAYMLEESVTLVTINYRLGPFGFLSTGDEVSPGNNGLKDQAMALRWVQKNIENFGGDSNRVTLFGESAGASAVQFHMLSPLSKGLFHAGISESGCASCFWSISEKANQLSRNFGKLYGCSQEDSASIVECLRQIDGKALVQGQLSFIRWNMYPVVIFGPVIEPKLPGAFLDDLPANTYALGHSAPVPWLTGFNADEGALNIASLLLHPMSLPEVNEDWDRVGPIWLELEDATDDPIQAAREIREYYMGDRNISFETRQNAVKMFSDRYVNVCGVKSIQLHANLNPRPVYAYRLTYRGSYGMVNLIGQKTEDWGISHIDDLIYLMNNSVYYHTLKNSDPEYKFSRFLVNVWVNFARTGKPFSTREDGGEFHFWDPVAPTASTSEIRFLELNLDPKMGSPGLLENQMKFWKSLNLIEDEADPGLVQNYKGY